MKNIYKVDCDVFGVGIWLFIGTHKQANTYVKRVFDAELGGDKTNNGRSIFLMNDEGLQINFIWISFFDESVEGIGILGHECLHAATNTLHECGVEMTYHTDEVLAYMQEFYFEGLLREIRRRNKYDHMSCSKNKTHLLAKRKEK